MPAEMEMEMKILLSLPVANVATYEGAFFSTFSTFFLHTSEWNYIFGSFLSSFTPVNIFIPLFVQP